MTHPAYRAVARRITDKYLAEHGMQPWTWPEDTTPERTANEAPDSMPDAG
jgi:hypothetical protein